MKLMHIFPLDLRQCFWQTASNSLYGEIIGANRAGKCAVTSHSGISITDRITIINEQNKSIATGPLYEQAEFKAI